MPRCAQPRPRWPLHWRPWPLRRRWPRWPRQAAATPRPTWRRRPRCWQRRPRARPARRPRSRSWSGSGSAPRAPRPRTRTSPRLRWLASRRCWVRARGCAAPARISACSPEVLGACVADAGEHARLVVRERGRSLAGPGAPWPRLLASSAHRGMRPAHHVHAAWGD
jgi:hypothetical protein